MQTTGKIPRTLRQLLLTIMLACTVSAPLKAQVNWTKPYEEPQDSAAAQFQSDEYAWRLFVALNWPADQQRRAADSTKKLGDDGPVVWESWANARDVFLPNGVDPGPWVSAAPVPASATPQQRFDALPLQQQIRLEQLGKPVPLFDPNAAASVSNETRLNLGTYDFVRSNTLYHREGQIAFFDRGVDISFPLTAKETKAQWRPISAAQKSRYHWVEFTEANGTRHLYGLTALHITTKDLPNWFWATFEHVDNPDLAGNEPWLLTSRDTFACKGEATSECNLPAKGIGLEGTKWENYRLRGTQIEFTDARGTPTLLANSHPEEGFQETSSCITCHSRASIGRIGGQIARLSIFDLSQGERLTQIGSVRGYVGVPQHAWFIADTSVGPKRLFVQQDFVWALARARSKGP